MPRAIEGVSHGTHFGGDYGFPRYGGRSRVSRYGIDYGDLRARRRGRHYGLRSSEGSYGLWPGALGYGAFGYPEVYGQTYPRWTGPFGGPGTSNNLRPEPIHCKRVDVVVPVLSFLRTAFCSTAVETLQD
ncbi:hypothetical protein MTO96_047352 [Rhipicephalus appendiculatus]